MVQDLINKAILASVAARREWDLKPVQDRAQILFKAADVISGPKRAEILAKTMIGQVVWVWEESVGLLRKRNLLWGGRTEGSILLLFQICLWVLILFTVSQGKTVIQAEIDAAAELIDFFRFNAKHAVELESQQPIDAGGSTNTMIYRGLEVRAPQLGGVTAGSSVAELRTASCFLLRGS